MAGQQLDLFASDRIFVEKPVIHEEPPFCAAELADAELIAALPDAALATAPRMAAEAVSRRLIDAVPALERLCRRLTGFGAHRVVPEQAAALNALMAIGGVAARQAVVRLVADRIVQGPTLAIALSAAARLGASLPPPRLTELLRDADPSIRAGACRCVRSVAPHLGLLSELLDDLRADVASAAAIALGRLGRVEARLPLMALLRTQPSTEVIEALAPIADDEVIVAFSRIARVMPDLAGAALDALDELDHPRAASLALTLRAHPFAPGNHAPA